jgi:hypothetical protein
LLLFELTRANPLQSIRGDELNEPPKKAERPVRDSGVLTPLTPPVAASADNARFTWRLTRPRGDESVRWERSDGYWVSLSLAPDAGTVVVADAVGRSEHVGSYEGALGVAASWRGGAT